ncbi:dystrophin isoform x3 [Limosa lapponica baueri]|uniref:Dystrophin isoform x3 n=1 Tax=Limosa lapponica baueri TaxID=1758121 RepID=A0A2I0U5V1_LIMLA|nr:dystrophin isoform x3 [Limosa lapponica baueri]
MPEDLMDKELQDGIGRQQTVVKTLNVTGEEIIEQSSTADAKVLKEQLESLNTRWQEICRQLVEKKKRLEEEKNILSEFQEDLNKLILWLEEADSIIGIPLEPGNEDQLRDCLSKVKSRAEELPPHKGILKRLNETGGIVLGSASLNPDKKHKLESTLKEANHRLLKVSKDLPEKQKEIEILLQDFIELDQQLNQVILWVTPVKKQLELYNKVGQPGAFDIKPETPQKIILYLLNLKRGGKFTWRYLANGFEIAGNLLTGQNSSRGYPIRQRIGKRAPSKLLQRFNVSSSLSFLKWGAQNWTQYSRWGLTRAEKKGRITSLELLVTLPDAPQDAIGLLGYKGTLLAYGHPVVHQDSQSFPRSCSPAELYSLSPALQKAFPQKTVQSLYQKKLEDLNADWKAINHLIQQLKEKPALGAFGVLSSGVSRKFFSLAVYMKLVTEISDCCLCFYQCGVPGNIVMEICRIRYSITFPGFENYGIFSFGPSLHPTAQSILDLNLTSGETVAVDTQTRVTKETTTFKPEMPSSVLLEVPALADFNKAWAELTDWLSRLDREIKSQRVIVGDLDDINDMIIKQKWFKLSIFETFGVLYLQD